MFKTSFFFDTVLEMGFDCTIPFVLVFLEASDQILSCSSDQVSYYHIDLVFMSPRYEKIVFT